MISSTMFSSGAHNFNPFPKSKRKFFMRTPLLVVKNFISAGDDKLLNREGVQLRSPPKNLRFPSKKWGRVHATDLGNQKFPKKRNWWHWIYHEEDGWFGLKRDEWLQGDFSSGQEKSDKEQFEAWKKRAEAIVELRDAQQGMLNEESRRWEDWIVDSGLNGKSNENPSWSSSSSTSSSNSSSFNGNGKIPSTSNGNSDEPVALVPKSGILNSVRKFLADDDGDDDMLYEDRIFKFASWHSAKFFAVLLAIPCLLDYVSNKFLLVPFLDVYVEKVPLAAEILDLRRSQKLHMAKELKFEKQRYQFEMEIGKSPPLTDKELDKELHHKALEIREEIREENRAAFANIWSDVVFGVAFFIILYFNPSEVAMLKFTGYKLVNNVSDAGKAFFIILISDTFLGYHSACGWESLLEVMSEHYGLDFNESAAIIFIAVVPVAIDTCVKLWLFKFLPKLSRNVSNILEEMQRH